MAVHAARAGVAAAAVAGGLAGDMGALHRAGMSAGVFAIAPGPISLADSMRDAAPLLAARTEQLVRLWTAAAARGAAGRAARL